MHQVDYVIFRPYLFLCLSLSMYLSSVSGRLSITCCDLPTGGNASPFRESNIISCCMVGRGNKTHTYNIISGFVEHTLIAECTGEQKRSTKEVRLVDTYRSNYNGQFRERGHMMEKITV